MFPSEFQNNLKIIYNHIVSLFSTWRIFLAIIYNHIVSQEFF